MNLAEAINPHTRQIDAERVRSVLTEPPGQWKLEELLSVGGASLRTHERHLAPGQGKHPDD